ncbi:hypothetical protein [Comamonas sp. 4034]|uniref:hypothetical protein n=1 Tax=Comamonas sp. 4034 TaxID=3156455 RepID=UPI003D230886
MLKNAARAHRCRAKCYQKQSGNAALLGLGWCVMAVLALVMLWLLAPLLIGIVVGLGVTVLLCQSIRIGRALQAKSLVSAEAAEKAARMPRWVPFAAMLFTLIGGATGWLTLFWLPEGLHPEQVLPLGTALLCALVVFVLVWLVGQLSTGWGHLRQGEAWNAAPMSSDWWVWALLWALPTGGWWGLRRRTRQARRPGVNNGVGTTACPFALRWHLWATAHHASNAMLPCCNWWAPCWNKAAAGWRPAFAPATALRS